MDTQPDRPDRADIEHDPVQEQGRPAIVASYVLVAAGVGLGIAGVVTARPEAGVFGVMAAAGVALVERQRSAGLLRENRLLRYRLRRLRGSAEAEAGPLVAELQHRVDELTVELELRRMDGQRRVDEAVAAAVHEVIEPFEVVAEPVFEPLVEAGPVPEAVAEVQPDIEPHVEPELEPEHPRGRLISLPKAS